MKHLLILLFAGTAAMGQTTASFDSKSAAAALSVRVRNPVKSSAAIIKRTYGRSAAKGLDVEIIERSDGTKEERPFVQIPIQFLSDSANLKDRVSQLNVEMLSAVLREIMIKEPGSRFVIQGHTSREGEEASNLALSQRRADKIVQMLMSNHADDFKGRLIAQGLGESCARFTEDAPESLRSKDRRVLVMRP